MEDIWVALDQTAQNGASQPDLNLTAPRLVEAAGITLDYTKSLINDKILDNLEQLAHARALPECFAAMAAGERINMTEDRAVLHMKLREPDPPNEIRQEMDRALTFADQIHQGKFLGATGRPITSILHLGIGGSYLGPRLICEALPRTGAKCRHVANIDPAAIVDALDGLDPATTLVVCVSKSGTTTETITNTKLALTWIEQTLGEGVSSKHLVVVSANSQAATNLGCLPEQSFVMWDWVGGRYSLWSPVSVSAAASCGVVAFRAFLAGAHAMDKHVMTTKGRNNMAVIMALLRIWHAMVTRAQTHCVVAYQHRLRSLPAYLQQLVMESNGKSTTVTGTTPTHPTSAIWWGGEGTNDQHSYFQLLLQGMRAISSDFIYARRPRADENEAMHQQLLAHCLGQSRALFIGRDLKTSENELLAAGYDPQHARRLAPHLVVPGGQPTNLLSCNQLEPATLGALLSLYEHMTSALGWLWNINSFDQWGVELGKSNFRKVLFAMQNQDASQLDKTTQAALARLQN